MENQLWFYYNVFCKVSQHLLINKLAGGFSKGVVGPPALREGRRAIAEGIFVREQIAPAPVGGSGEPTGRRDLAWKR